MIRQMPVRIVADGVLTRRARHRGVPARGRAGLPRARSCRRSATSPAPVASGSGSPSTPRAIGRAATPGGHRADPEDRPAARGARPPRRGDRARRSRHLRRRLPALLVDAGDVHAPHRPPSYGPGWDPSRSTTSRAAWPGTRCRTCTGCRGAIAPAAPAQPASRGAFHQQYDVALTPDARHATPLIGHLDPTQDYDDVMDRLLDWVAFTPLPERHRRPGDLAAARDHLRGAPQGMMFGAGSGPGGAAARARLRARGGSSVRPDPGAEPGASPEPISRSPAPPVYRSPSLPL